MGNIADCADYRLTTPGHPIYTQTGLYDAIPGYQLLSLMAPMMTWEYPHASVGITKKSLTGCQHC